MPRSRTASLIPAAAAAMGMGTSIALLLLLALSGGVAAFLSPHLPSSSGPSGRVAAGRTCVAPLGLHRIAGSPFLPQPARSQQPRLFASVDTEEKGKEEKAVAVVVDPKAQQELERLLAEGSDLLGLFEHLKAKRGQVKLTWEQAALLLDRMADSKAFRASLLEKQEQGPVRVTEKEAKMEDSMNPARAFMALEEWQKRQLEAVVLCYDVLKEQGLLRGFACIGDTRAYTDSFLPKSVNAEIIEKRSELPMTALTPGQAQYLWAYSGVALCLVELLVCRIYGVDAGAVIPATIGAFFLDRFLLGGQIFDQFARVFFPRYKERIIRHEAGHFLLAYLLGCPVQNCILRPVFNGAVFGEAGTIFLDKRLFDELEKARISASTVDRYTSVVMGGIASEAITFQNAQGGASDEQAVLLLLSLMNWDFARITSQARWAALRAVLILKDYAHVYEALVAALSAGKTVGQCVQAIEQAIAASDKPLVPLAALPPPPPPSTPPSPFDMLQRVMMPSAPGSSSSSSSSSGGDSSRGVGVLQPLPVIPDNVTPSFDKGPDAIMRMEARERRQAEEADKRLKQKMREVSMRLKRVTAQLEGRPVVVEEEEEEGEEWSMGEVEVAVIEEEESQIDAELKKVDARLAELKLQLGVGGLGVGGRRRGPPFPPNRMS